MPRFSLRQILLAIVALAIGFSIWRLPKGSWVDVPLAALSFVFVLSLCRHAAATRRLLAAHRDLPTDQRWGGRLLIVELLGTAITLIVAWAFRYLAAAQLSLIDPKDAFLDFVQRSMLPLNLAVLAMLVATGLEPWQSESATLRLVRQKLYGLLAAAGTLVVILAYWADQLKIWFLVYLAISNVEGAWPPSWLPPDIPFSTAVRIHRFTVGSLAGLALVIANVVLIAGIVKCWEKPRLRWTLAIGLAVGLAAQGWVAAWIGVNGLRQLSPQFQEAIDVPAAVMIVVAWMILLASCAFTWRELGTAPASAHSQPVRERQSFFHESWLGSLLLGFAAATQAVYATISLVSAWTRSGLKVSINPELIVYALKSEPAQIISIAAAIGGFALAVSRWRRRNDLIIDTLPCIAPAQLGLTMLGILILVVTSAPIIAAVSFSYWFIRTGVAF